MYIYSVYVHVHIHCIHVCTCTSKESLLCNIAHLYSQYSSPLCANTRLAAFLQHTKDYFCIYGYFRRSSSKLED